MGWSYKQMYREQKQRGKHQLRIFAGCRICHAVMSRKAINKHKDWCK